MQKTSYEMRISDWSSDVCSSDLIRRGGATLCHPKSVTRRRLYQDLARLLHDGASGAPPLAGRRALIADNNKANRRYLAMLCAHLGLETIEVEDGRAAYERWRGRKPDFVLLDAHLPILDGARKDDG